MADQESNNNKMSNNLEYEVDFLTFYQEIENEKYVFPPENAKVYKYLFDQLEYDNVVTIELEDNKELEEIDEEKNEEIDETKVTIDSETGETVKVEKSK